MVICAIDTSCDWLSLAILKDGNIVCQISLNSRREHARRVVTQLENLLTNIDLEVSDIDVFASSVGPGSFTGIRVGVSTIKALAQVFDRRCVSVSTLESLANNLYTESLICPLIDARRERVYTALFKKSGNAILRLEDDNVAEVSLVVEKIKKLKQPVVFCGDGAYAYREFLENRLQSLADFSPSHLRGNLASSLAYVAWNKIQRDEPGTYDELKISYVAGQFSFQ